MPSSDRVRQPRHSGRDLFLRPRDSIVLPVRSIHVSMTTDTDEPDSLETLKTGRTELYSSGGPLNRREPKHGTKKLERNWLTSCPRDSSLISHMVSVLLIANFTMLRLLWFGEGLPSGQEGCFLNSPSHDHK
jgi:hypothetical protein